MKVYLISGRTGAGKTTLAMRMADEIGAYRISHDELLVLVYGRDIPPSDFRAACERINELIWHQVEALSKLGVPVVIEGFGSRPLRDTARRVLSRLGIDHELVYVECARDVRWQRVQSRNNDPLYRGITISEADFMRMEEIEEELDPDEVARVVDNSRQERGHQP